MRFFSNLLKIGLNLKQLEDQAGVDGVLELPEPYRAFRVDGEVIVVDTDKKKEIKRVKDTFPSNPAFAAIKIIKLLDLSEEPKEASIDNKKATFWTCGFREDEGRWVWYQNSAPKMTVSYDEAFKNGTVEDKFHFFAARYGTSIIDSIKTDGIESTAKKINAHVLENSYVTIKCGGCQRDDNYTIDDIVDDTRSAKYDSNFVICTNCDKLIQLI